MKEAMEVEDQVQVGAPIRNNPIEIPEFLKLSDVQNKAIKWNSTWTVFYNGKKGQWEANYKSFRNFEKGLATDISTRVYEVWASIQTEIPHLVNSIFTKSEVVRPVPKFDDVDNNTLKVKNYINKMILVANQGRKTATDAIQDLLVFGTVVAKTFWNNEEISEYNIAAQQWVPKYEGIPSVYNVDIFDFAVDPSFRGHDVEKAEWTRERIYFKKEELKKLMEAGEIIQLDDSEMGGSSMGIESGKEIRDRIDGISEQKTTDRTYVDEFWATLFWVENGQQKSGKFYFWLLNNSKIIKFKKNVFNRNPFLVSRCYRLAHEFFGVGDVDVMGSLSEHINVVHTQGALLAKKTGQKLTLYTSAAGIDQQQLKRREDGVLMVKDLNAIKTENTTAGADLGTLINYKASVKSDLNNAVGINDYLRGEVQGDSTATEASILNANSSARLALKLQNFQDEYMVPMASNFYNLSKQFIDTYSMVVENQIINLTQEDFVGEYDWVAQGSIAQANKNLRIRQLMELSQQLAQSAQMAAASGGAIKFPPFDMGRFVQNEILSLFEIANPDQYFSDEMPTPPASIEDKVVTSENMTDMPTQLPINESPIDQASLEGSVEAGANSILS